MSEIVSPNYAINVQNPQEQHSQTIKVKRQSSVSQTEYFRKERRKNNGLIEKFYNGIKNLTGLGTGSKKVERDIERAKQGQITQKDAYQTIQKYSASQENSAQLFGDGASVLTGLGVFSFLSHKGKMLNAKIVLNKEIENIAKTLPFPKGLTQTIVNTCKSKPTLIALSALTASVFAGFTKYLALKINRIGSKEYKVDEQIYGKKNQRSGIKKYYAKVEKKNLNKERHMTNFKNFVSGMVNGAMSPLIALGGVIGAPLYLIGNSLNRYFIANKTDKNKSFNGYVNNLTNDGITTALVSAGLAVPLVKKGNFTKVLDENLTKTINKLKDAKLKKPDYASKSAYEELESTMLGSKKIDNIIKDSKLTNPEKITKLTEENIFAVKFKQISADGTPLTKALRDDCPPTRTLDEAQKYVNKNLGSGYQLKKILGVGTIAETYLATSPSGQEVCIKVVKKGIDKNKILADKDKFVDMVKKMPNKTDEEKQYLLKNIDDLADGIVKEVDFQNEMEAAKRLLPHTKVANVVKPLEVKNGIYVMEKANGISLSSLVDLNEARLLKETMEKDSVMQSVYQPKKDSKLAEALKGKKTKQQKLDAINAYIKKIESRTPEFGDITLSKEDAKYLIEEYMKVLVEQFNKVEKGGKIIHADIHPGNIFIDINAIRNRKGKVFTLIDTGNTVEQSSEQALRAVKLSSYIKRADIPDLTEYVLDGATLPKGMTMDEAKQKISEELKKCFFDTETQLDKMTNKSLLTLTSNIMRKYGIIPNDKQLNLNKAIKSADNSFINVLETLINISIKDVKDISSLIKSSAGMTKDILLASRKYKLMQAAQEKLNLAQMPLEQQLKYRKNPNLLKTNSEDYLTYELKQSMKEESKKDDIIY